MDVNDLRPANAEIAPPAFEKPQLLAMFICESPPESQKTVCRKRWPCPAYSIILSLSYTKEYLSLRGKIYLSEAAKRRSRWGSVRGKPVLSSHFSPGRAPHVGQRTDSACFWLTFMDRYCIA